MYAIELDLDISNDEDGQLKGVVDGNQWGEDKVVIDLINIATTLQSEGESTQDYAINNTILCP